MVFCFVQNFFFRQHKSYIIFFVMQSAHFFLQNVTLGYMTKTLNQIIIFFLHQNQNIFFSNIRNQNILLEKNHTPHWKLNGPSLNKNWKIYWPKQIYWSWARGPVLIVMTARRFRLDRFDCNTNKFPYKKQHIL
jgi:esterase/lipase superfamily enzyme